MKKRLLALMMSFVMVVSLVPFSVIPAQATRSEIGIVTASTDDKNIEMHLFNYGPGINSRDTISTEDNDSGFLIFHQGNYSAEEVEVDGKQPNAPNNCPVMEPYLVNNYPSVKGYYTATDNVYTAVEDDSASVKRGSLKYLFDKTLTTTANGVTHYTVSPGDGTQSTGLFQKQGAYYVYDSNDNAAWYNETNFTLYSQTVVPSYVDNKKTDETFSVETTRGNFLPFNELTNTTTKPAEFASGDGYTPSDVDADLQLTSKVDLWFGMSTEFNFYMPKDGKVGGNDMIFEFTGDDDVWVYIDGVLILDISGTHGALDGSINFATGSVSYRNSTLSAPISTSLRDLFERSKKDTSGFKGNTFKDYSEHTFDFYYLERGGNISNCKLKFNLDPIPQGNLSVEKVEANLNDAFKGKQTYTFELTDKDSQAMSGKAYQIVDVATNTHGDTQYTDSKGVFTLKDGQKAVFTNLTAADQCYVEEIIPEDAQYTVNNQKTELLNLEDEQNVVFTNTWTTTDLVITKNVTASDSRITANDYKDIEYDFVVSLTNNSFGGARYAETFTLKHDSTNDSDRKVIADVPYGTSFSLTESQPNSHTIYAYGQPSYKLNSAEPDTAVAFDTAFEGVVANQNQNTIAVTNSLSAATANLTISKTETGLNTSYAGTPEYIFTIKDSSGNPLKQQSYKIGTTEQRTNDKGEFTLHGGQSAVFELDVLKEYIVTEIVPEDSSYTANPATAQTVSLKDDTTKKNASVAFTNTWDADGSLVGQTSLRVTKELEGRAWRKGDAFTFTLTGENGAPMPTEKQTITINSTTEGHTDHFGSISYDETDIGKTYTYTVKEKDTSICGITKDSTVYTVSVKITDAGNNKLDVQPSYGDYSYTEEKGMVFTNTYRATGTLDGDTALKVTKTLTGRDWLETDAFCVQISAKDSKSPMPTGDAVLKLTNKDTAKDSVSAAFGGITYTEQDIGTHVYEVEEVYGYLTDYGKISRITYDTTVYTVTVTVTDNYDGTLTVTPTYTSKPGDWWFAQSEPFDYGADGLTFTNRYTKPKPPVDIEDDPPALNTEDHYAYIVGYPDGTVQPEDDITRAEVATIFFRMLTDEARNLYWCQTNDFTDVELDDWYNNAISTLSNAGILDGYPDGAFQPNEPITRAEFTKIAVSFFEYADSDFPNPYSDVKPGAWYYQFVVAANEMGLIEGYPDGTFQPEEDITRAEACTIVNRTLDRHPHEDHLLEDMILWPDNPAPGQEGHAWYYEQVQEATNSHTYEMKTGSETLLHEIWQELLPVRDWPALEKAWSDANSALGGEVMK